MSGATYLQAYSAVAAASVLLALGLRRWAGTGGDAPAGQLGGVEYGYLKAGPRLALYASVAHLRVTGSVQAFRRSGLIAGGPPVTSGELAGAVHAALTREVPSRRLLRDGAVAGALDRLRSGLDLQGLLLNAGERALLRAGAAVVLLVGCFGLLGVGRPADTPGVVTLVALATLALGVAALLPRWASPRGRLALTAARRANRKLAPPNAQVWSEHGPSGGALAVGLFGPGAMWAADPVFAKQAGIYLRQQLRGPSRRQVYDPSGGWAHLAHEDRTARSQHLDARIEETRGAEVRFTPAEVRLEAVTGHHQSLLNPEGHTPGLSHGDPSHPGQLSAADLHPFQHSPDEFGPADQPPAAP